MTRPSDREYQLKRKVKDLDEKNNQLEIEIKRLNKQLEKLKEPEAEHKSKKKHKIVERGCPSCGAAIKSTVLPFGKLEICSSGCGWREVKK